MYIHEYIVIKSPTLRIKKTRLGIEIADKFHDPFSFRDIDIDFDSFGTLEKLLKMQ